MDELRHTDHCWLCNAADSPEAPRTVFAWLCLYLSAKKLKFESEWATISHQYSILNDQSSLTEEPENKCWRSRTSPAFGVKNIFRLTQMDTLGIEPSTPRRRKPMLSGCDNQLHHVPEIECKAHGHTHRAAVYSRQKGRLTCHVETQVSIGVTTYNLQVCGTGSKREPEFGALLWVRIVVCE